MDYPTFYAFDRVRRHRKKGNGKIAEWVERPHFPRYIFAALRKPTHSIAEIEELDEVSSVIRRQSTGEPYLIPIKVLDELYSRAMVRFDVDGYLALMRELVRDPDKELSLSVNSKGRRAIDVRREAE